MCCTKISVSSLEYPSIPNFYVENNSIVFDTDVDFSIKLNKQLEALSDINSIRIDGVLGFSLPDTPKNNLILRKFIMPDIPTDGQVGLDVTVFVGSHILNQSKLYVNKYANGKYEVDIRMTEAHWIYAAKNKLLRDIDFGAKQTFDIANIQLANFKNQYVDGDTGYRYPLAFYGGWNKKSEIVAEDFRPYYFALFILQKGFCNIGWKFRSTILESDFGRRQIRYLLDENFGNDKDILKSREFLVNTGTDWFYGTFYPTPQDKSNLAKPSPYNVIIKDNGGNWGNVTMRYKGEGVHDFYVRTHYEFTTGSAFGGSEIHTLLMIRRPDGTVFEVDRKSEYISVDNGYTFLTTYNIYQDFKVSDLLVLPQHQVYVRVLVFANFGVKIKSDSSFYNEPKVVFFKNGSQFFIKDTLKKDVSLLDVLKGEAHLFNANFYTDWVNKEVWMYPKYETKMHNDTFVEGFFLNTVNNDITKDLQCDSESIETQDLTINRYKLLKFKGEGDAYVKDLKLKQPLHSYKVDFGEQYANETDISENPLYEATVMKLHKGITIFNNNEIDIPYMSDSLDDKISYNINPRALYWAGEVAQVNNGAAVFIKLWGSTTASIPFAFSLANAKKTPTNSDWKENVVYGEKTDKLDLYNLFYKKWLFESNLNLNVDLLVFLQQKDFFNYNFRENFTFNVLGRAVTGRAVEIRDFDTCKSITTPIKFIPVKQSYNSCYDIPNSGVDNKCATNLPLVIITKVGNCYNFSLGGVSTSPISSVTFEYKYVNSNTWISGTSLCNPTGAFEVRMTVDYSDDCPTLQRFQYVDACGNAPTMSYTYNYQNNCITFITGGVNNSPLSSILIEYSLDNGVTWQPYTLNSCVNFPNGTIKYRGTFTYSDGCPPIIVTGEFTLPIENPDCDQNTADVMCDDLGMFIRNGLVVGDVALDIIEYRSVGSNDNWQVWDEVNPVQPCPFEYRRVIFFCNNICQTYCGAIHVCNCNPCAMTSVTIQDVEQPNLTHNLTANTVNCGTPVYSWFYDDGSGYINLNLSTQTINVNLSGNYKVEVSCAGECDVMDDIDIVISCNLPLGTPLNATSCNDD